MSVENVKTVIQVPRSLPPFCYHHASAILNTVGDKTLLPARVRLPLLPVSLSHHLFAYSVYKHEVKHGVGAHSCSLTWVTWEGLRVGVVEAEEGSIFGKMLHVFYISSI